MLTLEQIRLQLAQDRAMTEEYQDVEYQCLVPFDLYDSPQLDRLATQVACGRHLRILHVLDWRSGGAMLSPEGNDSRIQVCLCEDGYTGWIAASMLSPLTVATQSYRVIALSEAEIQARIPEVIAFTQAAMAQPNTYLWGGTVGPNYDCSGLMQAAFKSTGIWLPRDAYQQEAFLSPLGLEDLSLLQPGDLIFFGPSEQATHVGLYLGAGRYLHSSGQEHGHNGIGIDTLARNSGAVGEYYFQQRRGAGRVVASYQPQPQPCS